MKSNVEFEAVIAIGLVSSVAVLSLTETVATDCHVNAGQEVDCVKNDIIDCGSEGWLDYLPNYPKKIGLYKVTGKAYFTEDEGQYDEAEFKPLERVTN